MDALENSLISKMSQMTTDDREVSALYYFVAVKILQLSLNFQNLIHKFEEIISPQMIPHDLAAFYLDLANW